MSALINFTRSIVFVLVAFFTESLFSQNIPTLTAIRGNYFILNRGADSILVQGLKNTNIQVIYFVFAAEEDPIGLDPGLSTDGRWRSINLLNILKDKGIAAFYSTPFRRNVLTLQPLSEFSKSIIHYYDQADLKSLYDKLNQLKSKDVVIMSHKESLPKIIEYFTNKPFLENIENQPYDRIFVLERTLTGISSVQSFRYDIR